MWRSYLAMGDSFTEGLDDLDPVTGRYRGWADLVAARLAAECRPAGRPVGRRRARRSAVLERGPAAPQRDRAPPGRRARARRARPRGRSGVDAAAGTGAGPLLGGVPGRRRAVGAAASGAMGTPPA